MASKIRKIVIICSCIFTILGMFHSILALIWPSWQIVNLEENNTTHYHGLFHDCIDGVSNEFIDKLNDSNKDISSIDNQYYCISKFYYTKNNNTFYRDENDFFDEYKRHKFYGWHIFTILILLLTFITSFISLCFGAYTCCCPSILLINKAMTLLTWLLSMIILIVFYYYSQQSENRFIKGKVDTYEQHLGIGYFLQMAATLYHFIAFVLALFTTKKFY
uniref:Candidate secreted effector n=1 Tax=Meloidogyne incognita TaxID=6306 RepID=A0A914MGU3_MELIC